MLPSRQKPLKRFQSSILKRGLCSGRVFYGQSALPSKDKQPDETGGDFGQSERNDQRPLPNRSQTSKQDEAEQQAKRDLDWGDDARVMSTIPIAYWAFKDPGCQRPKMRAAIIMMQRKIQPDVQQCSPRQRNTPHSSAPECDRQQDTPNHKTACYGGIFGLFFCQTYRNLSCSKLASEQNTDFMKNAQHHANCEVKPNLGKKQLEPKSTPIAFSIGFSQSSHTLHALYQKSSFSDVCKKTLQKCSQNPFFWSLKPFKKSPLKRIFHSRPQEKER